MERRRDDPRARPGHDREHGARLRRRGPDQRPRLLRVPPALPAAGLGRARRLRDLGGDQGRRPRRAARRRHRGRRPRRDRDHQPARDGRRLGPAQRRARAPGARLAGPAHGGALRRAQGGGLRAARARAHRPRPRPVLLGHEDRVAAEERRHRGRGRRLRHDRLLARAQALRRPRHRLLERLADAALRHLQARLGPGALRAARRRSGIAADAAALRPRLRDDEGLRRRGPGRGHRRRPAGGAVRPGLPLAPATPRTPTAPAASSCSTPGPSGPSRRRAC